MCVCVVVVVFFLLLLLFRLVTPVFLCLCEKTEEREKYGSNSDM